MNQSVVLVIEANTPLQVLLEGYLESLAMDVWMAHSCAEALAILEFCHMDLILWALNLPNGESYSLLRQWRADEVKQRKKPIPAIALSILDNQEHRAVAQAAGFQAYVQKPFELNVLRLVIRAILSQRQSVCADCQHAHCCQPHSIPTIPIPPCFRPAKRLLPSAAG